MNWHRYATRKTEKKDAKSSVLLCTVLFAFSLCLFSRNLRRIHGKELWQGQYALSILTDKYSDSSDLRYLCLNSLKQIDNGTFLFLFCFESCRGFACKLRSCILVYFCLLFCVKNAPPHLAPQARKQF